MSNAIHLFPFGSRIEMAAAKPTKQSINSKLNSAYMGYQAGFRLTIADSMVRIIICRAQRGGASQIM